MAESVLNTANYEHRHTTSQDDKADADADDEDRPVYDLASVQ